MKTPSQIQSLFRLARLCCLTSLGLSSQAGFTKVEINNPVVGTVVTNPDNSRPSRPVAAVLQHRAALHDRTRRGRTC